MTDLFEQDGFAPAVLADCARRELAKRRSVYPRLVADGKLAKRKADREIELMQAIAEHFEALARTEQQGGNSEMSKGST